MAFTFPLDTANKAGAVRVNPGGGSFHVPVVIYGPDGLTPISSTDPMPTQIAGAAVAAPVDVQYWNLKAELVNLEPGASVRAPKGTKVWLATNQDWSYYGRMVLRVENSHDQDIALFLSRQGIGDFMKPDGTREEFVVPANSERVLITPAHWPILGETIAEALALGAECVTDIAPTVGTIVVDAYVRPLI